jgi:hypothetical protein
MIDYIVRSYKSGEYTVCRKDFPFFEHTVRLCNIRWTCSCLSFRFKDKYCKHIEIVKHLSTLSWNQPGDEWETLYHLMPRRYRSGLPG